MGQYYRAVVDNNVFDTSYISKNKSCFTGAKLTEHAYITNPFVNAVAKLIYQNPKRVAWVGDYANENDPVFKVMHTTPKEVWKAHAITLYAVRFSSKKRVLVNHDKKLYIDMRNLYRMDDGCTFHPLPLMTAVGNGSGGGDYWGTDMDEIGSWAGDLLSIEDKPPADCEEHPVRFDEKI